MDLVPRRPAFLSRTVVVLGLVSLLQDAGSEMITPLLPVFLVATLGSGPAVVGLVEGVAEATASFLKLLSGRLADRGWDKKRLVIGGYGLSNTARPLIGLAFGWGWVLCLRFFDRVGKGLRTSPRDALISASTPSRLRGKAFGFHRALDHTGAVVGPLIAYFLLDAGVELRHVFLISVVPGLVLLLLLVFGLEPTPAEAVAKESLPRLDWRSLDRRLQALILAAGSLALASAPEVFLVLWAQTRGLEVVWIPLLWAAASAVKVVVAIPGGHGSDRFGRLPVLVAGWSLRVLILVALAVSGGGELTTWVLFLVYAGSLALTEGPERALVGDHAPARQSATAFGLFHMTTGLFALPGAVLFGALWQAFEPSVAFLTAAALTAASVAVLVGVVRRSPPAAA